MPDVKLEGADPLYLATKREMDNPGDYRPCYLCGRNRPSYQLTADAALLVCQRCQDQHLTGEP